MTRSTIALLAALLAGCGDDGGEADAPAAATSGQGPSAALTSALDDVRKVAPRLEGYYRSGSYPRKLEDVAISMPEAGLTLAAGNSLGAYRYDTEAAEFVLCVENTSGAFATYDTAPMALGEQGETGGCPAL